MAKLEQKGNPKIDVPFLAKTAIGEGAQNDQSQLLFRPLGNVNVDFDGRASSRLFDSNKVETASTSASIFRSSRKISSPLVASRRLRTCFGISDYSNDYLVKILDAIVDKGAVASPILNVGQTREGAKRRG